MLEFGNNKDIIVVDKNGNVVYFDMVNPKNFEVKPEEVKGKHILELYANSDENYPLIKVMKTGKAIMNNEQELTVRGNKIHQFGSAFPIMRGEEVIGAIEISECFYGKGDLEEIRSLAEHPIYRKNGTKYVANDIITSDPCMEGIKAEIERLALSDSTVLIYGKTGTGKELVAQSIHNASHRYSKRFVSQNCSAIPMQLLEGLLFGTTKGSFTGAGDRQGLFEMAEGGTLFLDEINSLNPNMQGKLLKAIEDKKVRRIGGLNEKTLDVRVIAATNEPLEKLVKEGRMREDLYYRLAVLQMDLPDLVDRGNDIFLLTEYYINYYNKKLNCHVHMPNDAIMNAFKSYAWPGNVRELRNTIESAFAFAETEDIDAADLPRHIMKSEKNRKHGAKGGIPGSKLGLQRDMEETEKEIIQSVFLQNGSNLTEAAKLLGVSKQLLKYKLDKYAR